MAMIGNIISFLFGSFVIGLCGRALMPGNNKMPISHTILLGTVGSFVGTALGSILTGRSGSGSFIGSVIGAIIALWAWYRFGGKTRANDLPRYQ
jgi:uncharacterized membrane protein YeaQ/YmgE (transglycosylase-associated protein family)